MYKVSIVLLLCLGWAGCSQVLKPVREVGQDIAYIIIAGAELTYQQYEALGAEIQNAVQEQRLWVQLSNNQYSETRGLILEAAKQQLFDAGFPSDGYVFGGGHSYGAGIAVDESLLVPGIVDALLLFGTGGSHDRETFPLPVYIINGDLDGQVRISITADSFSFTKQRVLEGQEDTKLRYPHKVVSGVNHAQFCTGELPSRVRDLWIEPEVTDDVSRQLLAEAMVPYFAYYSSTDATLRDTARLELLSFYDECDAIFTPILTAFEAEENAEGDSNEWTAHAQYVIADLETQYEQRLMTNNTLTTKAELGSARPEITVFENETLFVSTVASLFRPIGINQLYESAAMIEVKYKSRQSLMEVFTGADQPFEVTAQCKDANQAAWSWVWSELVTAQQAQRILARNITTRFLDDVFAVTGPEWLEAPLVFDFDGFELVIQSTNLVTSTDIIPEYAGMHYCKMLSPAKALEFILVDALYETFYLESM